MASSRNQQPLSTGLGTHFTSPVKPRDKKKTRSIVEVPGHAEKKQRLEEKLERLRYSVAKPHPAGVVNSVDDEAFRDDPFLDIPPDQVDHSERGSPEPAMASAEEKTRTKRLVPDSAALHLVDSWRQLLPTLLDPLLQHTSRTVGVPLPAIESFESDCTRPISCSKTRKTSAVICLFFDRMFAFFFVCLSRANENRFSNNECSGLYLSNNSTSARAKRLVSISTITTEDRSVDPPSRFLSRTLRTVL
jgi:hypothetical protein